MQVAKVYWDGRLLLAGQNIAMVGTQNPILKRKEKKTKKESRKDVCGPRGQIEC